MARPSNRTRPTEGLDEPRQTVLVLQGGGALGAYQGGVYESLAAHGHEPDWVVGTSIGAINGAIIAGNPPERRVARLREFWQIVGRDDALSPWAANPLTAWMGPWLGANAMWQTLTQGIPGFFEPRCSGLLDLHRPVEPHDASFYDTSALRHTLQQLIDFDYLNERHVRCTVCAVEVDSGRLVTFDNQHRRKPMGPEHIMASGALPPGFPPVMIDGKAHWDGGIYSNTPVDVVMDDAERRSTLCFMIDLWDPTEDEPRSISAAMARLKDIQYASRTHEHLEDHRRMQDMRRAIELLSSRLPTEARSDPALQRLADLGCRSTINIVRLIMKALPGEDHTKDIDFARHRLSARWQAGTRDALRALRHKAWLAPLPSHQGMVIHELVQVDHPDEA